jgi:hypothetical protein
VRRQTPRPFGIACFGGSPLEQTLAQEPPAVVEAIRRDAVESLERYRRGEKIRVMSHVICSVAERP